MVRFAGILTQVQRIARVHHYGLRYRISRQGPEVRYSERQLLGINNSVEETTRDMLFEW